MDPEIVLPSVVGIGLTFVVVPAIAIAAADAHAKHLVVCPENGAEATVRLDAKRAVSVLFRGGAQRVCACSRWPDRTGCDRACEAQIA
jgi:hypothetical protein